MAPPVALARAQFQHLTEQHEHGDDGGGLEIKRDAAVHVGNAGGNNPGARAATTL